jgi:hypothetical protein
MVYYYSSVINRSLLQTSHKPPSSTNARTRSKQSKIATFGTQRTAHGYGRLTTTSHTWISLSAWFRKPYRYYGCEA